MTAALNPGIAAAVDQSPKNGCTSPEAYSGALTSPPFDVPSPGVEQSAPQVRFQGWFEVESVDPETFDQATVEYSIDSGANWVPFGRLIDQSFAPTGGDAEHGYSNNGTATAPSFQPYSFGLPPETHGQLNVEIRFRFDTGTATGDTSYQGFRGMAVDDVSIDTTGSPRTQGFENSSSLEWTFDPAPSGSSGAPFWHILNNPQNISVKNPEINPDLVTLSDSGALPAAFEGTHVAWFGDDATGTYCGPDYAKRAPPPDNGSPATTTSTSAAPPPPPKTLDDLPNPQLAVTVNVQELSGEVLVGIPGAAARASARSSQKGIRYVPLSEARQIPVGSYIDTRKGKVRLQSARDRKGRRQNGDFSRGRFQVKQSRFGKGLTDLVLKGSSFKGCPRSTRGKRASSALSRRSIRRRLRSSARGRYRTRARGSAATVRGTRWETVDRCDGTLTKVSSGKVSVRDFRRKRTVLVRAGKSYLARVR